MKNDYQNKTINIAPNKPDPWLYWSLVPIAKFLAWSVFRIKISKDKRIKQIKTPFIAIGTHSSAMDVSFMMTALMPYRLNIICGRDVMTWRFVKPIAKRAGLIPISQFAMDINSIRNIKRAVDNGCSISIFPEGKISLDGRPLHYLSPSFAKLLKFLNIPVIMCHNNGGYSSRPKWYKKFKRGRVEQKVDLLFTTEEIASLSNTEIHNRLVKAFEYNDHIFQRANNIRYKSKAPARGLHYILYKCPKCQAEYQMESTDRELICHACNNTVEYTENGRLLAKNGGKTFDRIDVWYDYQRQAIRDEINKDDFLMSHEVIWERSQPTTNVYEEKGRGNLYIDGESIGFEGTDYNGETVNIKCPLKNLVTIVQKTKEAVDLTIDGVINRFYFVEGKYSVKYTITVEESFRKIHKLT